MKTVLFIILNYLLFSFARSQSITIDEKIRYQIIDGFGASDAWRTQFVGKYWPIEKREQIAELLFSSELDKSGNPKGIGLSIWRYYIGTGSAELGDSSGIQNEWRRSECFLNSDGTYDWSKNGGQDWFLRAAKEFGVDKFLGFSIAPPVFMSINGKGFSIKNDPRINVQPGKLDDYAEYLIKVLEYYKNEGIAFDYLSPFNEPQWDWSKASQEGTAATNEDIYLFTKYLSEELKHSKLTTKLLLGEAAKYQVLYERHGAAAQGDQIDVFFNPESALYLGDLSNVLTIITGHSYFTSWPPSVQYQVRRDLNSKLKEYPGLGFSQTEYCILEESPEIGSGHKRDLGMNTALFVARLIHSDITIAQSRGWQWWTALSNSDFKDGLIYLDTGNPDDLFDLEKMKYDGNFHESKLLWALGNYSRFVRSGMVRIHTSIDKVSGEITASAYADSTGQKVMIFTNQTKEKQKLTLPEGFKVHSMYLTDKWHDLDEVRNGNKKVILPSRSILTILGN